ncbi:hypothetical protein Dimus_001092 [Dionaea muscipula]
MRAHVLIDDESASNQRREKFKNDTTRRRKVTKVNKFDQVNAVMTLWATSIAERSAESTLRQQYLQAKVAQLEQKESSSQEVNSKENDPYSYKMCMEILNKMENICNEAYSKGCFCACEYDRTFVKPSRTFVTDFVNTKQNFGDKIEPSRIQDCTSLSFFFIGLSLVMPSSRQASGCASLLSSLPLRHSSRSPGRTVEGRREWALRSLGLRHRSPSPCPSRGPLYPQPGVELSPIVELKDFPTEKVQVVE